MRQFLLALSWAIFAIAQANAQVTDSTNSINYSDPAEKFRWLEYHKWRFNAWQSFDDYNPFDIKRSAGLGLRVFLPMFGTLGFDYGIGFDKAGDRSLNSMGKFSIILGCEPE